MKHAITIIIFNEVETKDLCTVRCSSTSKKGLLFCSFEVCRVSRPSYLDRLWSKFEHYCFNPNKAFLTIESLDSIQDTRLRLARFSSLDLRWWKYCTLYHVQTMKIWMINKLVKSAALEHALIGITEGRGVDCYQGAYSYFWLGLNKWIKFILEISIFKIIQY